MIIATLTAKVLHILYYSHRKQQICTKLFISFGENWPLHIRDKGCTTQLDKLNQTHDTTQSQSSIFTFKMTGLFADEYLFK